MKMGKTKALRQYIDKYFSGTLAQPIIRFLSFRQTFSNNIKEKFPDFMLYSDTTGLLAHDKLIIQIESLHRLDIIPGTERPDLLILDECESIFEQLSSGLMKTSDCFSKFQYLLKFSKHVVLMDAGISDRTYNILAAIRGDRCASSDSSDGSDDGQTLIYHRNEYKNSAEDTYFITANKMKWLGVLHFMVDSGFKIAVPISSLAEAKTIAHCLARKHPKKRIQIYSSETNNSEKREHFSDINKYWSKYDVLIYTPTVSAGVSFELEHFDMIFGYFTDMSCPIETCVQMIGRVRNLADKELYIYLEAAGGNMPTSIETIKQYVYTKRENMFQDYNDLGIHTEYTIKGELIYHESEYFQVWLENMRMRNLSRNHFIKRFLNCVRGSGAKCVHLSDAMYEEITGSAVLMNGVINQDLTKISEQHADSRVAITDAYCEAVAASEELTPEMLEDIRDIMDRQADLTEDQRYAYEKYKLRMDYRFDGPITEEFVKTYMAPHKRRNYKNLVRINMCDSNEKSLQLIQQEEAETHYELMRSVATQQHDLLRRYVFDQHRFAFSLVRLCGWASFDDPKYICADIVEGHVNSEEYWKIIVPACVEFQIKCPARAGTIESRMKAINSILHIMYDLRIQLNKKLKVYMLIKSPRFSLYPSDKVPCIK
jgi:hypothetical protein